MSLPIERILRMNYQRVDLLDLELLGGRADGEFWDCPAGCNEVSQDGTEYVLGRVQRGSTRRVMWVERGLYRAYRRRRRAT